MNFKENKGITLVALTITIIVLLIIAGIAIYSGNDIIKNAKLESLKTNMLLIQAKAKDYCEEASFKLGTNPSHSNISMSSKGPHCLKVALPSTIASITPKVSFG